MSNILKHLKLINQADLRQKDKIKYPLNEIIRIPFLAMTTDANNFAETATFAKEHQQQLKQTLPLQQDAPTHDTITHAFTMINPEYLKTFQTKFNEPLNTNQGKKLQKLLHITAKPKKTTKPKPPTT